MFPTAQACAFIGGALAVQLGRHRQLFDRARSADAREGFVAQTWLRGDRVRKQVCSVKLRLQVRGGGVWVKLTRAGEATK